MNVVHAVRFGRLALMSSLMLLALSGQAFAGQDVPPCYDHGQDLAVNNEQVLNWKGSTRNSFQARGHILGKVTQVYPDHSGHRHFQAQIGAEPTDTIEVIYNEDFGAGPMPTIGMTVEACGDYITSNAPAGPYPASPDNAIIHWVHRSPNEDRHPSGYMVLDGVVCGANSDNAGGKRWKNRHH